MHARLAFLAFCLVALTSVTTHLGAVPTVTIDQPGRGFTIQTERLEATFQDGRIVNLRNRLTGELIADAQFGETNMPTGLGHLSGGAEALSEMHYPWGVKSFSGSKTAVYYAPGDASVFTCKPTKQGVQAEWRGLQNETMGFPEEVLRIEAETDANGVLVFRASATSPTGGVFSVTVPLVNLWNARTPAFGVDLPDWKTGMPALEKNLIDCDVHE